MKTSTWTLVGFAVGWTVGVSHRMRTVQTFSALLRSRFNSRELFAPRKMVIVVRGDVSMSTGKIASQCAHAAMECFRLSSQRQPYELFLWMSEGQPKVVLRGGSDTALIQLYSQAKNDGLVVGLIQDAGKTEVRRGTYTALGIGPGPVSKINKVTGHLKAY